jgi:hypothetical protein
MNETSKRLVYWTPRILCIAYAGFTGFVSIFAMDVFSGPVDVLHKALDLMMHLIPTGIFLVILAIAWRREWIGAILFPLPAVIHLVLRSGQFHWSAYVVSNVPLLVIGALFLVNWRKHDELRTLRHVEEDHRNSASTVTPNQQTLTKRPYKWGKVQGVLLILGSFGVFTPNEDVGSPLVAGFLFVFSMLLGVSILRRNRLILPLVAMVIIGFASSITLALYINDEMMSLECASGLVIWAACGVYYYKRRSEFLRWV